MEEQWSSCRLGDREYRAQRRAREARVGITLSKFSEQEAEAWLE
jgi:hypothetical protein